MGVKNRYVSFRHFVKEAYERFVEQQSAVLVLKCADEFFSTRTVHYSCSEEAAAAIGEVDTTQVCFSVLFCFLL